MNSIARLLDSILNGPGPKKVGFVLLTFKFGDQNDAGRCNYISNGAERKDITLLFKELIQRFEGALDEPVVKT